MNEAEKKAGRKSEKNNVREKIKLPFISEDIKLLVQKIMQMAVDSRVN